jgi:hypothetical protein
MKKKQGYRPLRKAGKKKGNDRRSWNGQKKMHGTRLSSQERTRQKEKGSSIKYTIYVVILAIVLVAVAWFSLNVTVTSVVPGNALPFTTNYGFRSLKARRLPSATPILTYLATKTSSYLISMVTGKNWLWAKTGLLQNGGQSSPPSAQ